MVILGVPHHVDRSTVQPNGDWPLSARSLREHALRDRMVAAARTFRARSRSSRNSSIRARMATTSSAARGRVVVSFPVIESAHLRRTHHH